MKKKIYIVILHALVQLFLVPLVSIPILLTLPEGAAAPIIRTSKNIARLFTSFSELTLKSGSTCSQTRATCIPSFILEGTIQDGDGDIFERKLEALQKTHPSINTICLNSAGGLNKEAGHIAGVILNKHLNTCVGDMSLADDPPMPENTRYTTVCESACTIILLAGQNRTAVGNRFLFGLHSARSYFELGNDHQQDSSGTNEGNASNSNASADFTSNSARRDAFNSYKGKLAVPDEQLLAIIDAASLTPGGRMYFVPPKEQMQLKFFTKRLE